MAVVAVVGGSTVVAGIGLAWVSVGDRERAKVDARARRRGSCSAVAYARPHDHWPYVVERRCR